jgi:hypothetical protein
MNMPGFTAHNSLCRSNQHYISGFFSSWSPPRTVVPTVLPYDPSDPGECHVTCDECSHNCMGTCHNTCYPGTYPGSCCDSTETCCSGKCVNTKSDPANCGACGNVCSGGMTCINGVCRCPPGKTLCGNDCVDLSSDRHHCGACGTTCPTDQMCCSGTCGGALCGDGCCPKGQSCCGGGCCPKGQFCCAGGCCQKGTTCCNTTLNGWECCPNNCQELFGVTFCT